MPTSEPAAAQPEAGCGSALAILLTLFAFAVATTWIGIAATNLTFYFAGLPVSGLFALFGSDLVLAWPLDAMVWISAAWMIGSRVPPTRYVRMVGLVMAVALIYGLILSQFVEPTGSFL